ncbi:MULTISPECIES: DUF1232 domain-containing protein [unclassified Janthinobacterium]|nr:DUF1232 domain-containing protein [Janthinobacterium sp. CG_23.4]MDH6158207.1 uncharacterized membrane protein YkvA (DUF1232 family) [Janthinobacterium sp. CG_23.4]
MFGRKKKLEENHAPQADKQYAKKYTQDSFWDKVVKFARTAGREVIEKALWLYYAAQQPNTPLWAKTAIYGALGYFISPIDAVPDITPVIGYADDLAVLAAAVATVATYITAEVKESAAEKLRGWFGA